MRNRTRKNSSARTSQCGIRCGTAWPGGGAEAGLALDSDAAPVADPGTGAGRAGFGGEINSGCWDILDIRTPPPIPAESSIQRIQPGQLQTAKARPACLRCGPENRGSGSGTPYCNGNTTSALRSPGCRSRQKHSVPFNTLPQPRLPLLRDSWLCPKLTRRFSSPWRTLSVCDHYDAQR